MNSTMDLEQVIGALKSNVQKNEIDLFQKQLLNFKDQFQGNTRVASIIKMMQSIGKYIAARKDSAHKDALPVLDFITGQLEKISQNPNLKKEQADEILSRCAQHFNRLKKSIADGPGVSNKEIQDLKSVIFAIDWEISPSTLKGLNDVVTRLMVKFKSHKIHYTFLKIINNVGQYIAREKAHAHTDSIPFLHSVFEHFEKVVQTPEMPLNEKKTLLKKDMIRFKSFSRTTEQPDHQISPRSGDGEQEESIQPALFHLGSSPSQSSDDIPELNLLSENESRLTAKKAAPAPLTSALADKEKMPSTPRDVMDDLFTVKKTSADDLLDAIHLGNGHESEIAAQLDADAEIEGVKKIIPRRLDNEPIPEIGSRLDQFFNLEDDSEVETPGALSDREKVLENDPEEGIVPFQYEDEISEAIPRDMGSSQGAMDDLINILKEPGNCLDHEVVKKINEEIHKLETLWENDSDKLLLLKSISCLVQFINESNAPEPFPMEPTDDAAMASESDHGKLTDSGLIDVKSAASEITGTEDITIPGPDDSQTTTSGATDSDGTAMETPSPVSPVSQGASKGIWQKIKSVFIK
ncbi:hypothetical protein SAMN02746065_10780 [Desulfocicer vacuolatum DSM 3385]|uniref:Uncharacterized protein n=1 Tax=Desulfocicer vacuolatum DSM 3385 TaxID=1121400 RepID=A0A1W2B839_9BACT|nr:hypothetical protein [Desulfocicer vacuolatum]SMC69099.1 hypothetical protein SAMN02746065_10780 [Desulfocicer vacuolatum DSM 3385]